MIRFVQYLADEGSAGVALAGVTASVDETIIVEIGDCCADVVRKKKAEPRVGFAVLLAHVVDSNREQFAG